MAEETNEQKIRRLSEYVKSLENSNQYLRNENESIRAYAMEKEADACRLDRQLRLHERATLMCALIASALLVALLAVLATTYDSRLRKACPSGTAERVVEEVNAQIDRGFGERLARLRMDTQYYIGRTRRWLARGWENVMAYD